MVLYLKTFFSFIKIINQELPKCFLINEFTEPNIVVELEYLVNFKYILFDKTLFSNQKLTTIQLTKIVSINSKLFDRSFITLDDQQKALKLKGLIFESYSNIDQVVNKNSLIEI